MVLCPMGIVSGLEVCIFAFWGSVSALVVCSAGRPKALSPTTEEGRGPGEDLIDHISSSLSLLASSFCFACSPDGNTFSKF